MCRAGMRRGQADLSADPDRCPQAGDSLASPRLPMTLNVVLKAKGDHAGDHAAGRLTCAEIARRWLAAGDLPQSGAALAEKLTAKGGPLDLIAPENIFRLETNIQIAHVTKSPTRDFRTDYLMKVFDYDAKTKRSMKRRWKTRSTARGSWRMTSSGVNSRRGCSNRNISAELDRGTILIPEKFLATGAIAVTPVGFRLSKLQPEFGLTRATTPKVNPVFSEHDVVAALKQAAARGMPTQNIRSVAGFERRLNDITCSGCHQTRGIGGFHFPGVDWLAPKPSNYDHRAGLAAFLRRPGSPPRYPRRDPRRQDAGFLPRLFQPAANARRRRTRRHRIWRRLGRALLCAGRRARTTEFCAWTCARGSPARSSKSFADGNVFCGKRAEMRSRPGQIDSRLTNLFHPVK